jgi:hypothetical protein
MLDIYISHQIQNEILRVFVRNVHSSIRHNIGDAKFCLILDETQYESRRRQITLVIRFVDKNEFIQKCFFFDILHVKDSNAFFCFISS